MMIKYKWQTNIIQSTAILLKTSLESKQWYALYGHLYIRPKRVLHINDVLVLKNYNTSPIESASLSSSSTKALDCLRFS